MKGTVSLKISVVTAIYNSKNTILSALTSVRQQDYPHVEHVIVDGSSTDGTLEILRSHVDDIDVLISEPDTGMYSALNKGIRHSSGHVIGFLHGDDFFADGGVLRTVAGYFEKSNIDGLYGDLDYVSYSHPHKTIRRWRSGCFSSRKLSWGWMPPHPTLFLRKEVYERLGGFDETYKIAADYDFILRLLSSSETKIAYVPQVLTKMRLGGLSNRSLKNVVRKSREDYRALSANAVGGFGALVWKNISKLRQFI